MKNWSHRYDISGPRSKHEHKFSKHNTRHTMMMLIYIKQHLSNTWRSIHEKVKQHLVEKKGCL